MNKTTSESATDQNELTPEAESKTARKKAMSQLQTLGESLLSLEDEQLTELDLPDNLIDALQTCKKIKAREGKRRQLQFIGKLMRKLPESLIENIHALQLTIKNSHQSAVRIDHLAEEWREKLIKDRDSALQDFFEEYSTQEYNSVERNELRQIVRACILEREKQQPPRHYRKLFKILRATIATSSQETSENQ